MASNIVKTMPELDVMVVSVLNIIRNHLQSVYKKTRFNPSGKEWPPNQHKLVVSVTLIQYKGNRTQQELLEIAKMHKEGAPCPATDTFTSSPHQEPTAKKPQLDYSRVTKNITDIFAVDPTEASTSSNEAPKRILIEGAPGIGRTVMAKEIAYQWATNKILTNIKIVFLLYLRDPHLQLITTTKQLVEYMSIKCLDDEQITTFNKYLVNTNGQQLCIIMDGFDEYPASLQESSFIVNIINATVLPEAIVVVTSRPTATVSLHGRVDRRIDIFGLPKEEQDKYISQTFINSPEKKDKLEKYLKQKPVINGLCFVPLHLAVLLYLFQQGCLPETLTEMNESFILHTIYRHLNKYKLTPSDPVDKLEMVPKKILDIVYKLSELAYKGLQENKLVFTFHDVKQLCPNINETAGAINGFGLLQAVEHYSFKGAGTTISFNFLHYTMQEYLAALHVSKLSIDQQSSLMKNTFWDGHYNFMWMMFVGIVGVNSEAFVNFVSKGKVYNRKSGIRMAENILSDKRKRLHVFQCYLEAKSSTEASDVISDMFKGGVIILNGVELLSHHISSLMTFMSSSSTHWKTLELKQCNITDAGMNMLEQFISEKLSTLECIDLTHNKSSPWGVYCAIIRHCSFDSLTLGGDYGMKEYVNEITESLQKNTKLKLLKLKNVTNEGFALIFEVKTLQRLDLSNNSLCDDGAATIGNSLKSNNTLLELNISKNHISTKGLLYFMEAVQNNCTLQVVNITHNNVTRSGFTSIKQCIENLQHPIQIYASWNEINENGKLVTKISTFLGKIEENVWSLDGDQLAVCLSECLKEDDTTQKVNLCNFSSNKITSEGAILIAEAIKVNKTLKEINIHGNNICDDGAAAISDALSSNNTLQELDMSNNGITSEGAVKIAEAIKVNKTLKKIKVFNNNICDNGANAISDALSSNNTLQELHMDDSGITSKGAIKIAEAIKTNTSLHTLYLYQGNINDALSFNITVLTAVHHNNTLMKLTLPPVYGDDCICKLLRSEVEKINKERTRQSISTLTCCYSTDE